MKCNKCGSQNLFLYSKDHRREMVRVSNFKDKLYLMDPRTLMEWKSDYLGFCKDCKEFPIFENLSQLKVYTPRLNQEKLVLDLDHTLIFTYIKGVDSPESFDFEFEVENIGYQVKIRPHFKEFFKYAKGRFKEIHIHTASQAVYAKEVLKGLGIESDIKTLTTREDLNSERTLTHFDREYIKKVDEAIVIDDKPQVIWGQGNTVFKINGYWGQEEDGELLAIKKVLEESKKSRKIKNQWKTKLENILEDLEMDIKTAKGEMSSFNIIHMLGSKIEKVKKLYYLQRLEQEKNPDLILFLRNPDFLDVCLDHKPEDVFNVLRSKSSKRHIRLAVFEDLVRYYLRLKRDGKFKNLKLFVVYFVENKELLKEIDEKLIYDLKFYAKKTNSFLDTEKRFNEYVLEIKKPQKLK